MTQIVKVTSGDRGQDAAPEVMAKRLALMEYIVAGLDRYSINVCGPVIMDILCSLVMDSKGKGEDQERFKAIKKSLTLWLRKWQELKDWD